MFLKDLFQKSSSVNMHPIVFQFQLICCAFWAPGRAGKGSRKGSGEDLQMHMTSGHGRCGPSWNRLYPLLQVTCYVKHDVDTTAPVATVHQDQLNVCETNIHVDGRVLEPITVTKYLSYSTSSRQPCLSPSAIGQALDSTAAQVPYLPFSSCRHVTSAPEVDLGISQNL